MDAITATFMTFGVILLATSWILLIIEAFKNDFSWGLVSVFFPPLSYVYAFFAWDKAQAAIWSAGGGLLLILFAVA